MPAKSTSCRRCKLAPADPSDWPKDHCAECRVLFQAEVRRIMEHSSGGVNDPKMRKQSEEPHMPRKGLKSGKRTRHPADR